MRACFSGPRLILFSAVTKASSMTRLIPVAIATALCLLTSVVAADVPQTNNQQLAMDGYCPVSIIEMGKWEKGSPLHVATFDGKNYQFPTIDLMAKFKANPARYVPVLGGNCVVSFGSRGKRVPGHIRHAAIYHGRLYLFFSDKEKQRFREAPKQLADIDLALNGDCAVCLVIARKHISGKPAFVEYHDGLRYLFPSSKEQQMFQAAPSPFAMKAAETAAGVVSKTLQPPHFVDLLNVSQ